MAQNSSSDLIYFLRINQVHQNDLGTIRHWDNLTVAFDEDNIWIKGFTATQVDSIEIKNIPYQTIYYSKENKLFPLHSLLPSQHVPGLLWTPIERALSLALPSLNHNYFGLEQKIQIQLEASDEEEPAFALLVEMDALADYIHTSAQVRLESLSWVLVDEKICIILGTPILPIKGKAFWRKGNFLIPVGYSLPLFSLMETLDNLLNPYNKSWVVWNKDATYFLIDKIATRPLSISSFRQSIQLQP